MGMVTENGIREAVREVGADAVMGLFAERPRVLALGEPTHGEDALLELRNELFRQLVEEEGYRTVAFESCCVRGLVVDAYVGSGEGAVGDVMGRGFSHGFGASAANRELVEWMREFNRGRDREDRVRFLGFDGPLEISGAESPREALTALHRYLVEHVDAGLLPCDAGTVERLVGDDAQWTHPDVMTDPARSVGQSDEARELRLLAEDLTVLLDEQAPHLLAAGSREDWDRARLYGRTATGLLDYHRWLADTSSGRMARLLGVRDRMMAGNLLAAAERGPVLVHAHNAHLQRGKSSMHMAGRKLHWWSAGALVSARLGAEYGFVATGLGTIRHRGVDAPPADTLEGTLYAQPQERSVVHAARLSAALGDGRLAPRVSPYFAYFPLDAAQLAEYDGLLFVKDVLPR